MDSFPRRKPHKSCNSWLLGNQVLWPQDGFIPGLTSPNIFLFGLQLQSVVYVFPFAYTLDQNPQAFCHILLLQAGWLKVIGICSVAVLAVRSLERDGIKTLLLKIPGKNLLLFLTSGGSSKPCMLWYCCIIPVFLQLSYDFYPFIYSEFWYPKLLCSL